MRKSKFSESQIVAILKQQDSGQTIGRTRLASQPTRQDDHRAEHQDFADPGVAELRKLSELEAENGRLKRMYADLALENAAIKDVLSRKL